MNKLYKENGLLSEHGVIVTHDVKMAMYKLLNQHEEIKCLDEHELRVLGGALQKIVADAISDRIQFKREMAKKLAAYNDQQLAALLKAKYGERWMFMTLTPEELQRVSESCTGHIWHDEYGNESFQHDEFTYCPVHDKG